MGLTLSAGPASRPAESQRLRSTAVRRRRSPRRARLGRLGPRAYKRAEPDPPRALTPNAAFAPRRLVAVQRRRAAMPEPSAACRRFDLLMWSTVGASRDSPELSRDAMEPPHRFP
jgi:hypothetical protein